MRADKTRIILKIKFGKNIPIEVLEELEEIERLARIGDALETGLNRNLVELAEVYEMENIDTDELVKLVEHETRNCGVEEI